MKSPTVLGNRAADPILWFYRALGASLLACALDDLANGVWSIHTGRYRPWRSIYAGVPLFPAWTMAVIWAMLVASGLLVALDSGYGGTTVHRRRQAGLWLGLFAGLLDLSQGFSNHLFLILLILVYLLIPLGSRPEIQVDDRLKLIRYQLVIVYLFSALNKIALGFLDGKSLFNLGSLIHHSILPEALVRGILSSSAAQPLAWGVVAAELGLPVLLITLPRLALVLVIAFHTGITLMMPGVSPFLFVMTAMAFLFQKSAPTPNPD